MPDNDLLCKGVSRKWGKPFTQLVQWSLDRNAIGRNTLLALKNELMYLGNPPIYHLRDQANRFASLSNGFLADNSSYIHELEHIRRNARIHGGNKRGMNLAQQSTSERLSALQSDPGLSDHFYPMTRCYVEKVFVACYEAPVMRNAEISDELVNSRLNEIRPIVELGIDKYAHQLVRFLDVGKLRLPRGISSPKLASSDEIDSYLSESIRMN